MPATMDVVDAHSAIITRQVTLYDVDGNLLVNSAPTVSSQAPSTATGDNITTWPVWSTVATQTNVAASTSSVTLLGANTAAGGRRGVAIYNDSTNNLTVSLGATASAATAIIVMVAKSYYEMPFIWQGVVSGIWDGTNGNARIVEFT